MIDAHEPARDAGEAPPRRAVRKRARRAIPALAALLGIVAAIVPATAGAASYTVHSCRLPTGAPAPTTGWESGRKPESVATSVIDQCASGGALGAAVGSGVLPDTAAWWTFRPPAGTRLTSALLTRSARTSGGSSDGRGVYGAYAHDAAGKATTLEGCNGLPCPVTGDKTLTFSTPPAALRLQAWCFDNGDRVDRCNGDTDGYTAAFSLKRAQLTLDDVAPPALTDVPAGSLLVPSLTPGPRELRVSVADAGAGVGAIYLVAGTRIVAQRAATCAQPYTSPTPCPATRAETLTLDTATLGSGSHDIRVVVTDAAGNVTTSGPYRVDVAAPGRATHKLHLTSAGRGKAARAPGSLVRSDYTRPPTVRGLLVDSADKAVPGAVVGLYTRRPDSLTPDKLVRTARTDAKGAFELKVPKGTSRVVTVAAFPGGEPPRTGVRNAAAAAGFTLRVRAHVSWRKTPKQTTVGRRVHFPGKLAGGAIPRRGKLVELQALDGRKWRTIDTRRTSSSGSFRFPYRFSSVRKTTRYKFRIRVRYEASYPFSAANSSSRSVTVRP